VWTGHGPPTGTPGTDPRWVEVWNHVRMRYHRHSDGSLQPLEQSNVDTGMGLERLVTILQGQRSVYDCDVMQPLVRTVRRLWHLDETSTRLVGDHLRSSVVVVGDGVRPSNTGRGYVLRRLLRRLLTVLWRDSSRSLSDLPDEFFLFTLHHFRPDCGVGTIREVLREEETRFRGLLERGRPLVSRRLVHGRLTDEDYRYLHDTHGLPRELVTMIVGSDRSGV